MAAAKTAWFPPGKIRKREAIVSWNQSTVPALKMWKLFVNKTLTGAFMGRTRLLTEREAIRHKTLPTAIITLRKIPEGLSLCSWPRSSLGLTLLASPVIEGHHKRSLRTQQVICTIRVLMICHVLPFSSFLILISSTWST